MSTQWWTQCHLRISNPRATQYRFACGIERNPSGSMTLSSTTNPQGVTCANCRRTKALKAAMEVA